MWNIDSLSGNGGEVCEELRMIDVLSAGGEVKRTGF